MIEFFYTMLLIFTGASVGLSLISAEMHRRLMVRIDNGRHLSMIAIRIGIALTNTALLFGLVGAIGEPESSPPDWRGWCYLVGLLFITAGLWFEGMYSILELARREQKNGQPETS